jgi:predicted nucleic acid-binding protein
VRSQSVVFDTSIYIPYFRGEAYRNLVESETRRGRNRVSSVVLQELYAGTRSPADKRLLDNLNQAFAARGLLLTPGHDEWVLTGQLLNQYGRRHGFVTPRHHVADILILLSTVRSGAVLITENVQDFSAWLKLLRRRRVSATVVGVRRGDHRAR